MSKKIIICLMLGAMLLVSSANVADAWWSGPITLTSAGVASTGAVIVKFDGLTRVSDPLDEMNKAILATCLTALSSGADVQLEFAGNILVGAMVLPVI